MCGFSGPPPPERMLDKRGRRITRRRGRRLTIS